METDSGLMENKLNIGFIQFDISGSIDKNVSFVKEEIEKLSMHGMDMIIIPEMWSCGFNYKLLDKAAEMTPQINHEISALAKKHKLTIIGSLPEKDKNKLFNTAFCIGADGKIIGRYKKIHLFPPIHEDKHFTPGHDILTFSLKNIRIGVAICFDIRFPEMIRKLASAGINVLAVCAQWPKVRYFQWVTLLKARAIENQIFVIAANRCGKQGDQEYLGHSIIINPYGETVYEAHDYEESSDALIDMTLIDKFKKQFDCLALRNPNAYKI